MPSSDILVKTADVEGMILSIRGRRVILDADLARVYGVPTKRLNEQVKRNLDRFPIDFAFQLTAGEFAALRSQSATSSLQVASGQEDGTNWSQFATSSRKHRGAVYRPYAFTEHGAIMAATVLNSPRAVQMSVFVVRAFVKMRSMLTAQKDLAKKLAELEKKLTERLDLHEHTIGDIIQQIMLLLNPPVDPDPPRKGIGFHVRERRAVYRVGKRKAKA
jgi:hypothetical protein